MKLGRYIIFHMPVVTNEPFLEGMSELNRTSFYTLSKNITCALFDNLIKTKET